jgi:hypothetical protein
VSGVPYKDLDPNIRKLVRVLDERFELEPFSSCGGHENRKQNQAPAGTWFVALRPPRSDKDLYHFEVLAAFASRHNVRLLLLSSAIDEALLNGRKELELRADDPGATLWVALHGEGITPNKFAMLLAEATGGER